MPDLNVTTIILLIVALMIGVVIGWLVRSRHSVSEKATINAGWQEQLEAQRTEHGRLMEQNKSLMEQNTQYQASNKDAKMRASELADALKEAFARRDELQRQIKEIRSNLEVAVRQRDQLQNQASKGQDAEASVRERDEQIEKLRRELDNWQERLPPLIERYRQRNAEAEQLEADLEEARDRISALESMVDSDETRVESVDPEALGDDLDASNEPIDDAAEQEENPEAADVADEPGTEADGSDEDAWDEAEEDEFESLPEHDSDEGPEKFGAIARDNLKLIKGVGPAIEKTLNEMGIFRLNQIAEMSEYDIDRVARRLKGFRSRIYREDWMGQARELLTQKASG
jgi:predicted flap endonuclease-1-like 5' DNA nuclease